MHAFQSRLNWSEATRAFHVRKVVAMLDSPLRVVGQRASSPETTEKATGLAKFVSDVSISGMLAGKIVRSPYPHARVNRIDKSKAEALSGVIAVLTPDDTREWELYNRGFEDLRVLPGVEPRPSDEPILKDEPLHFGDAIAAIAAVDEATAEEAAELLSIEWEELPFVLDPEAALGEDAPQIHARYPGNVLDTISYPFAEGNPEEAFEKCAVVLERTYGASKTEHSTQEPAAVVAHYDPCGRLRVWSGCQNAHFLRRALARVFRLSVGKVQVLSPYAGGKFGQGLSFGPEPIAAALTIATGRPVKIVFAREENMIGLETRTSSKYTVKMGFDEAGTLLAMTINSLNDLGAYPGAGPMAAGIETCFGLGHYRCPNRAGGQVMVFTNKPPGGGMRGVGNTSITWGVEQLIDEAAEMLGLDPVEIRQLNIKSAGEPSNLGAPIQSYYLEDCIREGAEAIDWSAKRAREQSGKKRRGVGIATMTHCSGAAYLLLNHSNAIIKMNEDGTASLTVGAAPIGVLSYGTLAQIAAEELGIEVEDINVLGGDTDATMFEFGAGASRQCYNIGNAVKLAAKEAREKILERAAEMLAVPAEGLEVRERQIVFKGASQSGLSIADVCDAALYNLEGQCENIFGKCSWESPLVSSPAGACFAEVEVDVETGSVEVLEFVTAMDCGKAVNPMTVEGQLEGGLAMGLGYALTEDYLFNDTSGEVLTTNWSSYKTFGPADMPNTTVLIVDKPDPVGPFGAKGVGENGVVAVAPAVANAIYNAIGVRITDLPITAEKLLDALDAREVAGENV